MSENSNAPKPEFPKGKRPTPNPKRVWRIAPFVQRTALGRFFAWLRTPEHKWEFGIKVVTLVVAVAGTWLLLNQNALLKSQNNLLENQNGFIRQQMSLEEASRRSALIVLMSNIMDKVDDEIKEQGNELLRKGISKKAIDTLKFSLSQSLIGQIAALSHSFKPYKFLDFDTLITIPLSPERGQLLITLTHLPLDTTTFINIYKSSTFANADLQGAVLDAVNLSGANLSGTNLSGAFLNGTLLKQVNLRGANLSDAFLKGANLEGAYLGDVFNETSLRAVFLRGVYLREISLKGEFTERTDFYQTNLSRADLTEANLSRADLRRADLTEADLSEANLSGANLAWADLSEANLSGANLAWADLSEANLSGANLTIEQAKSVKALFYCKKIHDSIKVELLKTHPQLFE